MKGKIKLTILVMVLTIGGLLSIGCERKADAVSRNLSLEADNFNDVRQLTVINCINGDVIFQMTGKMSIKADTNDNQLEVVVEIEEDEYKKHFIGLSDNVTYVVEDITGDNVSSNYTINFNPDIWLPNVETIK